LREEPKHISEDDLLAWPIIVAWIHYVSIMLMIASLLGEHLLLKQELTAAQAGTVQRLDIVYGASAAIVLITGILRMFLEKGAAYYNHHIAFHILFGIFVIAALMSIYPTLVFLRWRSDTSGPRTTIGPGSIQKDSDDPAGGDDPVAAGAASRPGWRTASFSAVG
jgi:putative membrane protein